MTLQNYSIAHNDVASRAGGDVLLVCDHHNRDSTLVELLKNSHDLDAGPAVEIAGRLICKQHLGFIDQRARNRYALLLAAGELARVMIFAPGKPNRSKNAICSFAKLSVW